MTHHRQSIDERKALYERIFGGDSPPVPPAVKSAQFCLLPAAWLRSWITGVKAEAEGSTSATSPTDSTAAHTAAASASVDLTDAAPESTAEEMTSAEQIEELTTVKVVASNPLFSEPIANQPFLCSHSPQGLQPKFASAYKRLTVEAYKCVQLLCQPLCALIRFPQSHYRR